MSKRSSHFIGMVTLTFGLLIAPTLLPAQGLTLRCCIEAALQHHPSREAFRQAEESKTAETRSLQSESLPRLDFLFRGNGFFYQPYTYRTLNNQLFFVWDVGKWVGKLREIGASEEEIARLRSRQNRLDLILQVKQAYFRLAAAQETGRIARSSERYLAHHLQVSEQLFRLGQIDRLDLYTTQRELSRVRESILAAEAETEAYRIELANLTGLVASEIDSLEVPPDFHSAVALVPDTLLFRRLEKNPALAILEQQRKQANLQANLEQKSRYPKLYLGGGYTFDNDPTSDGDYATIAGSIQLPILDWGKRKQRAQALQLQAGALQATRAALWLNLRTRLQTLLTRLRRFSKMLALKEETIRQAQKTYQYTELNYRAGTTGNTEVLLAQQALFEARVSREKLIFTLHLIEAQIEHLIGQAGETE